MELRLSCTNPSLSSALIGCIWIIIPYNSGCVHWHWANIKLRPRQNRRHFPDDIFKCICWNENMWIFITISLKFVPRGQINNIPALVQIMAWRRPGDKPLSEPMMFRLSTHICVARPQCVKDMGKINHYETTTKHNKYATVLLHIFVLFSAIGCYIFKHFLYTYLPVCEIFNFRFKTTMWSNNYMPISIGVNWQLNMIAGTNVYNLFVESSTCLLYGILLDNISSILAHVGTTHKIDSFHEGYLVDGFIILSGAPYVCIW